MSSDGVTEAQPTADPNSSPASCYGGVRSGADEMTIPTDLLVAVHPLPTRTK